MTGVKFDPLVRMVEKRYDSTNVSKNGSHSTAKMTIISGNNRDRSHLKKIGFRFKIEVMPRVQPQGYMEYSQGFEMCRQQEYWAGRDF